jgi:hypothetical protein
MKEQESLKKDSKPEEAGPSNPEGQPGKKIGPDLSKIPPGCGISKTFLFLNLIIGGKDLSEIVSGYVDRSKKPTEDLNLIQKHGGTSSIS